MFVHLIIILYCWDCNLRLSYTAEPKVLFEWPSACVKCEVCLTGACSPQYLNAPLMEGAAELGAPDDGKDPDKHDDKGNHAHTDHILYIDA